MNLRIPYFYVDLIARMVPGAVMLLLLKFSPLVPSNIWPTEISGSEHADVVIIPILFACLSYVIGTVFETLLAPRLENKQICEFEKAARDYAWTYAMPREGESEKQIKNIFEKSEHLSRASFNYLAVYKSEAERAVMSHIMRTHAEAKMCYSLSLILAFFSIVILVCLKLDFWTMPGSKKNAIVAFIVLCIAAIGLWFTISTRLKNRGLFAFRAIERFAADKEASQTVRTLRDQLWLYSKSLNPNLKFQK